MSKAPEQMIKRQVVLADGRYLIFYTFAPADGLGSSHLAVPISEAEADKPAGEN